MGASLKEGVVFPVARGPVPRERQGTRFFPVARGPVPRDGSCTVIFIVARGPVPRDRWRARA